jgi:hypothetical protein
VLRFEVGNRLGLPGLGFALPLRARLLERPCRRCFGGVARCVGGLFLLDGRGSLQRLSLSFPFGARLLQGLCAGVAGVLLSRSDALFGFRVEFLSLLGKGGLGRGEAFIGLRLQPLTLFGERRLGLGEHLVGPGAVEGGLELNLRLGEQQFLFPLPGGGLLLLAPGACLGGGCLGGPCGGICRLCEASLQVGVARLTLGVERRSRFGERLFALREARFQFLHASAQDRQFIGSGRGERVPFVRFGGSLRCGDTGAGELSRLADRARQTGSGLQVVAVSGIRRTGISGALAEQPQGRCRPVSANVGLQQHQRRRMVIAERQHAYLQRVRDQRAVRQQVGEAGDLVRRDRPGAVAIVAACAQGRCLRHALDLDDDTAVAVAAGG